MKRHPDLEPLGISKWSEHHARHLLNRAGFGVPEQRVAHLASLSAENAAAELVFYRSTPDHYPEPSFLPTREDYIAYNEARKNAADEPDRRKIQNEWRVQERAWVTMLQAWWMERMMTTPRPLQEKMTLFWHGHFATSAQKVQSSTLNYRLNRVFRTHAVGNFKELTTEVGQSPAMLGYLDNDRNVKQHPNENWARELMELFTMGVGNYTEDDIKESARAFTGWTQAMGDFRFDESKHDFGEKTFFGRTGSFDGWDIIDIIFEQPITAEYIARELWTYFAYEKPDPELVKSLADILRENDYDLQPMLQAMFASRAFYSDKAMGTQIKCPVQYVIQLAGHLDLETPPYLAMARSSAELGQALFYPPNVKGWDGGRAWINANSLLQRYNMSRSLIVADMVEPDEMSMLDMGMMRGGGMNKLYQQRFKESLEQMPQAMRRVVQRDMKNASTKEERQAIAQNTVLRVGTGDAWDVRGIFTRLEFKTTGECVDALATRYLQHELSKDQRKTLAAALTPTAALDQPLSADTMSTNQMTAVLHLVFSLAEYQLC